MKLETYQPTTSKDEVWFQLLKRNGKRKTKNQLKTNIKANEKASVPTPKRNNGNQHSYHEQSSNYKVTIKIYSVTTDEHRTITQISKEANQKLREN